MRDGYKDSPLGEIPINWKTSKLGKVAKTFAGGTPKRGVSAYYGGTIPWIKSGEVNNNSIENSEEFVTELALKETSTKLIQANSILVAMYGATAGKVGVLKVEACSNQAVLAVSSKTETLTNNFLYHYLKKCTIELLNLCQGSGQPNLSKGIVDSVQIPIPPLPEQQKIADILSTVDAKIDLIDQQIVATQELKKGLMQRLLTQGIGHTKFKDSPLGKIPESWEVVKQSEVATFYNGRAYKRTEWEETGNPVIRLQNLTGSGKDYYYSNLKLPEHQYCHKGDLLYMWSATFGPVWWFGDKAIYHYHIWKIDHDTKRLDKNFHFYLLDSVTIRMKNESHGSTMLHVTKGGMEKLPIQLPSLMEQKKISLILISVDEKLNVLHEKKATYQELKQGLMQQLLTGKVRVKV